MKSSAFFHRVVDSDRDPVAPVSLDRRTGKGTVHNDGRPVNAIGADDFLADSEVVRSGHAGMRRVFVRIRVRTSPWAPRLALWHRSAVAADPGRESSSTWSSKLRFTVGVVLRQPWVEVGSPRQPS